MSPVAPKGSLREGETPVAPSRGDVPFQGLVMKKDDALLVLADPGAPGLWCLGPSA